MIKHKIILYRVLLHNKSTRLYLTVFCRIVRVWKLTDDKAEMCSFYKSSLSGVSLCATTSNMENLLLIVTRVIESNNFNNDMKYLDNVELTIIK